MKDDTISRQAARRELFGIYEQLNDTISRRDAVEAMAELQGKAASKSELLGISKAWKRIKALPSAQQEIVACGDCIHWICHDRRCGYWNHGVKPLDWCCHAERRTNG